MRQQTSTQAAIPGLEKDGRSPQQSMAFSRTRFVGILVLAASLMLPGIIKAQDEGQANGPASRPSASAVEFSRPGVFSARMAEGVVELSESGISMELSGATNRSIRLRWAGTGDGMGGTRNVAGRGAVPSVRGEEVVYFRELGITESVRVTDSGATHSIHIPSGISGQGDDLVLYQHIETDLTPETGPVRSLGGLTYYEAQQPRVHYGPAMAIDASGRETPVEMQQEFGRIGLVLNGAWLDGAQYPIRVEASFTISTITRLPPPPPPYYTAPVSRVQLKLITAGVASSGTDDHVLVSLNDYNWTNVDYGRNDFELGDNFTYDLTLKNVATMTDIKRLRISKGGTDGWCIRGLTLFVNGKALYSVDFGLSGHWLDNNNGLDYRIIYMDEGTIKRDISVWGSPMPAQQTSISRAEMESRVESIVGDYLKGNDLSWGKISGRAVEVSAVNFTTIHVDLDLILRQTMLPDPEVDVDFDIQFQCSNNKVGMVTKNVKVKVDYPLWFDILTTYYSGMPLSTFLGWYLGSEITDDLSALNFYNSQGQLACPSISVQADGSVKLDTTT